MKELIDRLMAQGLTEQQALKAIEVVKDILISQINKSIQLRG